MCEEKLLFASGPILQVANGVCIDLEVKLFQTQEKLSLLPEELFELIKDNNTNGVGVNSLSIQVHPLELNLGRLEINPALRGVESPTFAIGHPPATISTSLTSINYCFGDIVNAKFKIWHYHWYPAFYGEIGPSMGTYLTVPKAIWSQLKDSTKDDFYLIGKLTILDKRDYNRDGNLSEVYNMVKV